jgi:hypothetical protein
MMFRLRIKHLSLRLRTAGLLLGLLLFAVNQLLATRYYINGMTGNDKNSGTRSEKAWKSIAPLQHIHLTAGDSVLFAGGLVYLGTLQLKNIQGRANQPVYIGSYTIAGKKGKPVLDAGTAAFALHIQNSSFIEVDGLELTGRTPLPDSLIAAKNAMRCALLVEITDNAAFESITLKNLLVHDVYAMPPGFVRTAQETQSANGTQVYGWGIRFINETSSGRLSAVRVQDTEIYGVSHTGLKLTGRTGGITELIVDSCYIHDTGGPGLQMSGVTNGIIRHNRIDHSGSVNDSRNWGRGSGMWTWSCKGIIIEHNRFENANGPGDSAGVHIDYNCNDVVVQYNLSANNAGGFCEILGNNFNCAYRYNISINDGHRVKGEKGAFQEGKTFWLSGYQGNKQPKAGPYNSYFYNNTIYVREGIQPKIAVSSSAEGVLIANNIFYFEKEAVVVAGDQKKGETDTAQVKGVHFMNNLFLKAESWPRDFALQDAAPVYGDPLFPHKGGLNPVDYTPGNSKLIRNKGIRITALPADSIGLRIGLEPAVDFAGNPIIDLPDIGAFEWRENK